LTEEEIKELVKEYLNTSRAQKGDHIEPFQEDSLAAVLQRSQGNVRQILSLCGRAIDEGIKSDAEKIEPAVVEQAMN